MLAAVSFGLFAFSYFMRAQLTADELSGLRGAATGKVSPWHVLRRHVRRAVRPSASHKVPAASGLSNFLRITAAGFATSIITTFWDRREALHQSQLAEAVTQYSPAYQVILRQLHHVGLTDQAAAGAMTQVMIGQGYLLSSLDLFYASAWLSVLMIPLCFLVRRPAAGGSAPVASE